MITSDGSVNIGALTNANGFFRLKINPVVVLRMRFTRFGRFHGEADKNLWHL